MLQNPAFRIDSRCPEPTSSEYFSPFVEFLIRFLLVTIALETSLDVSISVNQMKAPIDEGVITHSACTAFCTQENRFIDSLDGDLFTGLQGHTTSLRQSTKGMPDELSCSSSNANN